MASKKQKPTASVLTVRRRRDGSTSIAGDLPAEHTFSARWLARELGQLASVTITVTTDDETAEYELTGFEPITDADGNPVYEADGETPRLNWTGLRAKRKGR